jgi:hypothetical protein
MTLRPVWNTVARLEEAASFLCRAGTLEAVRQKADELGRHTSAAKPFPDGHACRLSE